ncbi:hypothetical protein [Arthrobacter sp. CAN_A1]|uniref:hypothetical protein n=1 Tax=Arthrobacter sp. CAN_A1 TaxID=2787717 RepID=UPI0018CAA07B
MKIVLLGAIGLTGKHALAAALDHGHDATVPPAILPSFRRRLLPVSESGSENASITRVDLGAFLIEIANKNRSVNLGRVSVGAGL